MIERGDIYYADLAGGIGSEQKGVRPVVIVQNNMGNKHSTTLIVVPISKKLTKPPLPTHVIFQNEHLDYISMILCEQLRTIDKKRLKSKITHLNDDVMNQVNLALKISLNIQEP